MIKQYVNLCSNLGLTKFFKDLPKSSKDSTGVSKRLTKIKKKQVTIKNNYK